MARRNTEAEVEFVCIGECALAEPDDAPTWIAEGRWNAEGEFEAESHELNCDGCGERGEPTDSDVRLADI